MLGRNLYVLPFLLGTLDSISSLSVIWDFFFFFPSLHSFKFSFLRIQCP